MSNSITDLSNSQPRSSTSRAITINLILFVLGIAGFYWARAVGEANSAHTTSTASTPVATESLAPKATGATDPNVTHHVLATLATVIVVGFFLGKIFRYLGQPPVIGEVIAGICLGPSLLGFFQPEWMHWLIPEPSADPHGQVVMALKMIAQLGVLMYMFVVGLELNAATIKRQVHTAVAISHLSIVFPFLLGGVLSLWLHPRYAPSGVSFTSFSLFVGVAMSITAFPVLARILTDQGLSKTRLGSIALASAAAGDLTAWCLLAAVVGIVQSSIDSAVYVAIGAALFVIVMLFAVRPLARRLCEHVDRAEGPIPLSAFVVGLAAVLVAGLITESIGIHAIFGGFLLGAIIPHDSRLANELRLRLNDLVTILLLPAFFALTGMRTQFGLVSGWENWLFCVVIILVATLGKFGGTYLAARTTGSDRREATGLGILMNTRGLMELIVLDIGLSLGVISPTLFTMMVIMALVTTMVTSPLLLWVQRGRVVA